MSDKQMQSVIEAWFEDTDSLPPDSTQSAAKVMARVQETHQRGRWLPFSLLHRTSQTAMATDPTEDQPTSIPATNGHSPSVQGRTQSMFSPVKAIAAGVVVFALGGVLLVAQPFDQQDSAPGVATDDPAMAPSFFTGDAGADAVYLPGSTSEARPDGVVLETSTYTARWISTDPRIEGQMTNSGPWLDYRVGALSDSPTGESGAIGSSLVRVVNDDGAWEGTLDFLTLEGSGTDQGSGWLVGEDAYAGLAAYVVIDYNSPCCKLSGHITSEGRPSAPEAFPEQ